MTSATQIDMLVRQAELILLKRRALIKSGELLEDLTVTDKDVSAWCADLTENLSGEVGTVEVPGESTNIQIQPGYEGNAAYSQARDGQLTPTMTMTPAQAYFNLAVLPGWQKWKPTFRYGTITETDGETCTVTLDAAGKSSQQTLVINQTATLSGVEFEYMECDGAAFSVGDEVLIKFEDQNWATPKVVGFKENPKPCNICCFVVSAVTGGTTSYIIYDINKQALASLLNPDGSVLEQPFQIGVYTLEEIIAYNNVGTDTNNESMSTSPSSTSSVEDGSESHQESYTYEQTTLTTESGCGSTKTITFELEAHDNDAGPYAVKYYDTVNCPYGDELITQATYYLHDYTEYRTYVKSSSSYDVPGCAAPSSPSNPYDLSTYEFEYLQLDDDFEYDESTVNVSSYTDFSGHKRWMFSNRQHSIVDGDWAALGFPSIATASGVDEYRVAQIISEYYYQAQKENNLSVYYNNNCRLHQKAIDILGNETQKITERQYHTGGDTTVSANSAGSYNDTTGCCAGYTATSASGIIEVGGVPTETIKLINFTIVYDNGVGSGKFGVDRLKVISMSTICSLFGVNYESAQAGNTTFYFGGLLSDNIEE